MQDRFWDIWKMWRRPKICQSIKELSMFKSENECDLMTKIVSGRPRKRCISHGNCWHHCLWDGKYQRVALPECAHNRLPVSPCEDEAVWTAREGKPAHGIKREEVTERQWGRRVAHVSSCLKGHHATGSQCNPSGGGGANSLCAQI